MLTPLISVVTVVYNGETTIRDTLDSILKQLYSNVEYIVINGMSTDNTLNILESYSEKFKEKGFKYRLISEKDEGIYDAMNKGIDRACGEIIGFLNADDWYEKDALEVVAETYRHTQFDMMYADINIIKQNNVTKKRARLRSYITSRDWNHPTTFVRAEILKEMKYKCENIYDDFDLMIRIRQAYPNICIINRVLANFRIGGISNQCDLKKVFQRIVFRYHVYRTNRLSRFYIFECIFLELVKAVLCAR